MFLREILFYAVPAWIAYMLASKHRKKYIDFMNSSKLLELFKYICYNKLV